MKPSKMCEHCGRSFTPERKWKLSAINRPKYCSSDCNMNAWALRRVLKMKQKKVKVLFK